MPLHLLGSREAVLDGGDVDRRRQLKKADSQGPVLLHGLHSNLGFGSVELSGCQVAPKAFQVGGVLFLFISDLLDHLDMLAGRRQTIVQGPGAPNFGQRVLEPCEVLFAARSKFITALDRHPPGFDPLAQPGSSERASLS